MDNNEYKYLSLCDGYLEDNYLWFSNNIFNAFCKTDLDTMKTEVIAIFKRREKWQKALHRKIIRYDNFFYFIPNNGCEIDIIDCMNNKQDFVKIPDDYLQNGTYEVSQSFMVNGLIWIFPVYSTQSIIIYDIKRKKFLVETKLTNRLKNFGGTVFSTRSVLLDQDSFWMIPYQSNYIICYNWKTKEIKEYQLKIDKLYSIEKFGDCFWLSTLNTNIIMWNYKTGEIKQINVSHDILCGSPFFYLIYIRERVYILPKYEKEIFIIDKDGEIYDLGMKENRKILSDSAFMFECIYKNELLLFPYTTQFVVRINLESGEYSTNEMKLSDIYILENYYSDYKLPFIQSKINGEALPETYNLKLSDILKWIVLKENKTIIHKNGSNGKTLWNVVNND